MDNPDMVNLINQFVGYEKLIKEKVEQAYRCAEFINNEEYASYSLIPPHTNGLSIMVQELVLMKHGPELRKAICLSQLEGKWGEIPNPRDNEDSEEWERLFDYTEDEDNQRRNSYYCCNLTLKKNKEKLAKGLKI